MRKLLLLFAGISLYSSDLKIDLLSSYYDKYDNNKKEFYLFCINGYQWLQYSDRWGNQTPIQMFENATLNQSATPIKCENKAKK